MNDVLGEFLFLSVFHLIGALVVGLSLRQLLARQFACNTFFLLIWGIGFGITPLSIGAARFESGELRPLFFAELFLVGATIAVAILAPEEYMASFFSRRLFLMAFGGLLILLGAAVFGVMVRAVFGVTVRNDLAVALLAGLVMLAGGIIFAIGLIQLWKNRDVETVPASSQQSRRTHHAARASHSAQAKREHQQYDAAEQTNDDRDATA
jgi:uncharacterized membrane protein